MVENPVPAVAYLLLQRAAVWFVGNHTHVRALAEAIGAGTRLMTENDRHISLIDRLLAHASHADYCFTYGEGAENTMSRPRRAWRSSIPNDRQYRVELQPGYLAISTGTSRPRVGARRDCAETAGIPRETSPDRRT